MDADGSKIISANFTTPLYALSKAFLGRRKIGQRRGLKSVSKRDLPQESGEITHDKKVSGQFYDIRVTWVES